MGNSISSLDTESALRHKILTTYAHQPEELLRIFYYLDREAASSLYRASNNDKVAPKCPPVRKRLIKSLDSDTKFREASKQIISATQAPELDEAFKQKIGQICTKIETGDTFEKKGFLEDEDTVR